MGYNNIREINPDTKDDPPLSLQQKVTDEQIPAWLSKYYVGIEETQTGTETWDKVGEPLRPPELPW